MRGKGAEGGTNLRNIRITPAYAGKSTENACVTDAGNRITPAYAGKRPQPLAAYE